MRLFQRSGRAQSSVLESSGSVTSLPVREDHEAAVLHASRPHAGDHHEVTAHSTANSPQTTENRRFYVLACDPVEELAVTDRQGESGGESTTPSMPRSSKIQHDPLRCAEAGILRQLACHSQDYGQAAR